VGCDDGTVILVDVSDGQFVYSRALERQVSRVLSLAWHPNGNILVGGCSDSTIRVWELAYGRILSQMKVEYTHKRGKKRMRKLDTLVWAVQVTSNGTVVSGDSSGSLKIWDSRFWSLTHSFQVHKADILCLALDDVLPSGIR
jgi:U3 small nucleolar RNA-associated protein 4